MDSNKIKELIEIKTKSKNKEIVRLKAENTNLKKILENQNKKITAYEYDLIDEMPYEIKLRKFEKTFHQISWDKIEKRGGSIRFN